MSTTAVSAGQVMDRAANLLNDPNKTDYTYAVQLPYLNLAIEEFSDLLAESNSPHTNLANTNHLGPIFIPAGIPFLVYPELESPDPVNSPWPKYPPDLIEIQEIAERPRGNTGPYIRLPRREFGQLFPQTNSLLFWTWELGIVRFNSPGANIEMEVQMKYTFQGLPYVVGPDSMINMIGSRTYLSYKTAALCALYIGENESRAKILDDQADKAAERSIAISNKGRQQIMTRHRPFRASYKMRGGY